MIYPFRRSTTPAADNEDPRPSSLAASSAQRLAVQRRTPDRAKRGRVIVRCNGMLDRLVVDNPAKLVFEVVETGRADPTIAVLGAIAFSKDSWRSLIHELCTTKLTMVVIRGGGSRGVGLSNEPYRARYRSCPISLQSSAAATIAIPSGRSNEFKDSWGTPWLARHVVQPTHGC